MTHIEELHRGLTVRELEIWEGRSGLSAEVEEDYRRSWRGQPAIPKPSVAEGRPCTRRGKLTGEIVGCRSCANATVETWECSLFGTTTLVLAAAKNGVACCKWCEDAIDPANAAHWEAADAFVAAMPSYPELTYHGRGIVIVGGGKYWPSVYVTIRMLRHVGCTLPVEVWCLGSNERDPRIESLLAPFGVTVIDALAHPEAAKTRGLTGFPDRHKGGKHPPYQLKSFAVLHSPFREVLYLDADNYPCSDPTPLFDDPRYRETGAIFWPDLPHTAKWTHWKDWRVEPFGPECGLETGQYLIDKWTAWEPLNLARWYDDRGEWCYGWGTLHHDHGDKGPWRVAWAKLKRKFAMYSVASPKRGEFALVQLDPTGEPLFVHRCMSKFVLDTTVFKSTPQTEPNLRAGLPGEDTAFWFLEELRGIP